ncbi:MAG: S16 family serine protease [Candidatus Zixiibacteriota bacterium]
MAKSKTEKKGILTLPILPLKDVIAFPGLLLPLVLKNEDSIRLVDDALASDKHIGLFSLKNSNVNEAGKDDIFLIGTDAVILKLLRFPDGSLRFLCQSLQRIKIKEFIGADPYFTAQVETLEDKHGDPAKEEALMRMCKEQFTELNQLSGAKAEDLNVAISSIFEGARLSDMIVSNMKLPNQKKQEFLSELSVENRLRNLSDILRQEVEVVKLTKSIKEETSSEIEKSQKEYYLRQQLKTIQKELGMEDENKEVEDLLERIEDADMPEEAEQAAMKQLDRLSKMNPASSEYSVTRTYLDWLIELPWTLKSHDEIELKEAERILEEDHYDLKEAKERILEFLAVLELNPLVRSPIILFIGPPGVGKTSLGKSIARSMGRKFYRMSLGGMKDEAEIRGHRRTYVGALPGRIIQGIKSCGTSNPVFMLDEVDKIGQDFRGDPASALLEVLDPEQNFAFQDHYLEVTYDLSNVMFIATANYLDPIPRVLLDRMEMIRIPGYTRYDKLNIAKKYLIPKQLANNGLAYSDKFKEKRDLLDKKISEFDFTKKAQELFKEANIKKLSDLVDKSEAYLLKIESNDSDVIDEIRTKLNEFDLRLGMESQRFFMPDEADLELERLSFTDGAINEIIDGYTREAGLRNLERTISSVCRKVARKIVNQEMEDERITKNKVSQYLGPRRYISEDITDIDVPGVSVGLAWTQVGGHVLLIEAKMMPGRGNLKLTGSLGKVMQESAQTALSFIKSISGELEIDIDFSEKDIHIHVPAGATPKDGPSAGITIASALASLFTGRLMRPNYAMTGEITLRGDVEPIGGLKEKALAAHRLGIKNIIIPNENKKDIEEIPDQILDEIKFIPVEKMREVLDIVLEDKAK